MGSNQKNHYQSRIENLSLLQDNWDNDGSPCFSSTVIERALVLLEALPEVPHFEVFPTLRGTVQFEWETPNFYLEFEIYEDKVSCLKINYTTTMHEEFWLDSNFIPEVLLILEENKKNL